MKTAKFTSTINVRFSPDIRERLSSFATTRSRSEADVIREAVYTYLDNMESNRDE